MPARRQYSPITLEELPIDDYEADLPHCSDDELDESARAAKRRKIEKLGESYQQGKPLFIASASLRGPFDNGWANPWKKDRTRRPSGVSGARRKANAIVIGKSASLVPNDRKERVVDDSKTVAKVISSSKGSTRDRAQRGISVSSTPAWSGRQQRRSPWIAESSASRMTEPPPTTEFATPHTWLRKDKSAVDIQNYDPPNSPSSRYSESRMTGTAKRIKHLDTKTEAGIPRRTVAAQTNVLEVTRSTSGPKTERSEGNETSPHCARPPQDNLPQEPAVPTSGSSVRIVPPSSHLPEFKYLLPKKKLRKQPEVENGQSVAKRNIPEKVSPSSQTFLGDNNNQVVSAEPQTNNDTIEALEAKGLDSGTSEKITSAQIVSRPLPNYDHLISLHSTELHGLVEAGGNASGGHEELSTQEALQLAQKSFQEDLVTPEKESDTLSETKDRRNSSSKRITPFSHVNDMQSRFEIQLPSETRPGIAQNINTQAMIDSVTPFSVGTPKKTPNLREQRLSLNVSTLNTSLKRKPSFVVSPQWSPSADSSRASLNIHTQASGHDSSALQLALSVTTPATEQQDGQHFTAGMDTFDLSQVIQDAGSWLQQSWEIGKDLKRQSGKSSQSSQPALRREVTPT